MRASLDAIFGLQVEHNMVDSPAEGVRCLPVYSFL